jgi:hypothetical protein
VGNKAESITFGWILHVQIDQHERMRVVLLPTARARPMELRPSSTEGLRIVNVVVVCRESRRRTVSIHEATRFAHGDRTRLAVLGLT